MRVVLDESEFKRLIQPFDILVELSKKLQARHLEGILVITFDSIKDIMVELKTPEGSTYYKLSEIIQILGIKVDEINVLYK